MRLISCRYAIKMLFMIVLSVSLSGCGVTLSPVKRKPLQIDPPEMSLAPVTQSVLVRFENTLPDKPLSETVWDNASGAFWDVEESNQIGYTQNYNKLITGAAIGGALGGVIGGAVVGLTTGPTMIETRIVIPFGRIFTGIFQSGVRRTFAKSWACFDDQCESHILSTGSPDYLVRVKVTEFQVWEHPTNHINLNAIAVSKVYRSQNLSEPLSNYEGHQRLENQSIGSVFSTSSGFIAEMNGISNRFAGALSKEIITKIQNGFKH